MTSAMFTRRLEYFEARPTSGLWPCSLQVITQLVTHPRQVLSRMPRGMSCHQRSRSLPQRTRMQGHSYCCDPALTIHYHVHGHAASAGRRTLLNRCLRAFEPAEICGRGRKLEDVQIVQRSRHAALAFSPPDF